MTNELRKIAAQTLSGAGVCRMPVSLTELARRQGVQLFTYRQYAQATGLTQQEVVARYGADGFTQRVAEKTAVFYREGGNLRRTRWTVAHELAHLLLGHLDSNVDATDADRDADRLAAELLCPTAVVTACGCCDSSGIAELCDISPTAARGVRLACGAGELSYEEQRLLDCFGEFIAERRSRVEQASDVVTLPRLRSRI